MGVGYVRRLCGGVVGGGGEGGGVAVFGLVGGHEVNKDLSREGYKILVARAIRPTLADV